MVARKPLPEHATLDPAVAPNVGDAWSPPNAGAQAFWEHEAVRQQAGQQRSAAAPPSDIPNSLRPGAPAFAGFAEENNVWAEGAPAPARPDDMGRAPSVLRPGRAHQVDATTTQSIEGGNQAGPVPTVLRPGGEVSNKAETNPFKRKMSLSASQASNREEINKSTTLPNFPPVAPIPTDAFSQLSVNESSANPWRPAPDESKDAPAPPVPRLPDQDRERDNVWDSARQSPRATPGPRSSSPTLLSLPSEEGSAGWEELSPKPSVPPPLIATADEEVREESHAWEGLGSQEKGKRLAPGQLVPDKGSTAVDDWNLIDLETHPGPPSKQSTWENFDGEGNDAVKEVSKEQRNHEDAPPELPPRRSTELPPPAPPRPVDKLETYQIKNINWHDATAAKNPRTSPILVQNANGPCPLVALVNALSLTTPADKPNTALVETLRSREQVSLGLLLDAVFDELMSERRTQPDVPLPDVSELYNFLQGLHTGMNVNPRYIPTEEVVKAFKSTSLTHLPADERSIMIPGTFEHTKEMALYATFSIPLIHGWLPSKDDPVYDSFARQAASYEDAQNLLFREEELEEKLSSIHSQGLTEEEQQIYQDILTIKSFLSTSATQLTRYGLNVIRKSMKPGSVAILFRNDHFSTLYRHPQTLELLTLVTDAGYAGHPEVVWESLVDINGESAEFFSGDFRLVGGALHEQPGRSADREPDSLPDAAGRNANSDGWTTVQNRRGRNQTNNQRNSHQQHEQEDRDLALALQLQEEEDARARAAQERRRRESLLSEQFIEQQARSGTTSGARSSRNSAGNLGRGRGGSHSTSSLVSSSSASTGTAATAGRRISASAAAHHVSRSSNASSSMTSVSNNASNNNRPARPVTQTVRSLLPPRTPANNNNRPPEEGLDDAPPSYEQAAGQAPYVPPAGHPSHPASSPRAAAGPGLGQGRGQGQGAASPPAGRGGGYPGPVPRQPMGMRRGPPPPQAQAVHAAGVGAGGGGGGGGGGGRDRECVLM